ncbi:hypothetical protein [Desulfonema ishimotonii]|nr:hypothetical protein [Desulfonema ishimotonii]
MGKIRYSRETGRKFGTQRDGMGMFRHSRPFDDNARRLAEAEAKLSQALARTRALELKIAERITANQSIFQSGSRDE